MTQEPPPGGRPEGRTGDKKTALPGESASVGFLTGKPRV